MNKFEEVAVLYSGGTDSTCAAAVLAKRFHKIHLVTFKRSGMHSTENTNKNVCLLEEKIPDRVFIHRVVDIEWLVRFVSYNNFLRDILRYGFFGLSNCVVCCLINHFGILIYCLDNNIKNVADGSTRDWFFFPSHMEKVIALFKDMYGKFGIDYHTPVYDFDTVPAPRFIDKIYPAESLVQKEDAEAIAKNTTGNYLFKLGIFSSRNIKGTNLDHKMQPRCLQFILHHIYIYWYFMARHSYADFEEITLRFIKEKQDDFIKFMSKDSGKTGKFV